MKKYLIAYKNSLAKFMQYRLNLGLLGVSHLIALTGVITLWLAVYRTGQQVGTYTLYGIIFYYCLITILRVTISDGVGMGFRVSDEINLGMVTNYLLKPFSYSIEQWAKMLGEITVNSILAAPFILLGGFIVRHYISLPGTVVWFQLSITVLLAIIVNFLIYYLASLSAFWLHRGSSAIYGTLVVSNLLSGSFIPLDLFPDWFQTISAWLPFQYLLFIPAQTFLGRVDNWFHVLLVGLGWTIVLFCFIVFTWKSGVRKFEAVGR